MKQEAKLGVLGGMGLPTRLPPRGDPRDFKLLGANESPRQRRFGRGPNLGPPCRDVTIGGVIDV